MTMTKESVIARLIEGERMHARDLQQANSQIDKMLANKNMAVKDLAKLVKLKPYVIRKFRRIAREVTIV